MNLRRPWPQYFRKRGATDNFRNALGTPGIPALMLQDKQGNVREMNGDGGMPEDFEAEIENLLAEP
jgi:hypothetical protein